MTCISLLTLPRPLSNTARRLPLWLLLAGLGACGGGGSGSATTPPPENPPPAFGLSSAVPADAASGVARDAVISATFNAALDAATVTASNVTLTGPGNNVIPAALTVNGGSTVEVRPKAGALPGDTRYTVVLTKAVKDSTGRTLAQDLSRVFTTASANWSAASEGVTTLPDFVGNTAPLVHTDAAGRTTVAWLSRSGPNAVLYAARLESINGTWSQPVQVAAGGSDALFSMPGLAPGPNGDMFLTWSRSGSAGGTKPQLSKYSAASATWSAPEEVQAAPASTFPVPIGDVAGNLMLLCHDGTAIYATRRNATSGAWSELRAIEHPYPNNYVFLPRALTDGRGNVVAAWMQLDQDGRAIYAARFDVATVQWAAAQRVDSVPRNGTDPFALGVDAAGVVTLAWTRSGGVAGGDTVWASRLDAQGRGWSAPVRVDRSDPAAPDARGVNLVVDSAGTATALWQQGGLRGARWAPGAAEWAAPAVVAPQGSALTGAGLMLADTAGNVVVVGTQLGQQVLSSRYQATTGQWLPAVLISTPSSGEGLFTGPPVGAVDGAGNVVAMWFAQNRLGTANQFLLASNRLR